MKWELLAKLLKRYYFLIMICAAAAGMMMYGRNASADGGINSNEARVISVATGGFSYNNELYTARQEYVDQLIAYLCRSDVNLTESQADKAISAIYANIETGVNEGYIVKQGAPEDDLDTENEIEITEVSPEQRRQGINDVSEINKATPAPGSITYSEEGKAQIYNNDGDVIVSLNGILKNTGLSDRAVNICVLTFAFVFICIALFTVVFIVSERRKYNES